MEDNKYTEAVTEMVPEMRQIDVLIKQRTNTTKTGLMIETWWVKDEGGKPFTVQVLGSDASLEAGKQYMCLLRERTQTRIADGRVFTELQVAGAQEI